MNFSDLYDNAVAAQAHGEYLHLEADHGRVAIQPLKGGEVRIIDLDQPDQDKVLDQQSYEQSEYTNWEIARNLMDFFNRLGANHGTE